MIQPKPERVVKLSANYSIFKRAPLTHAEIKKIQESISKGKTSKR